MRQLGGLDAPAVEIGQQVLQRVALLGLDLVSLQQIVQGGRQRLPGSPCRFVDDLHRAVAQAAFGQVDDALEGKIVVRLHQHAEIGDGIADLATFVEAQAPDHAVFQAHRHEALFEGAGLVAGAHQDGDFVQRGPVAFQRLDLFGHDTGLLVAVPDRSEERRVGKEGRLWWLWYYKEENTYSI